MGKKSSLFLRGLLKTMPAEWRNSILRDRLNIQYQVPDGVTFKMASTQSELEQSFKILHDAYVQVGLMNPSPSGLRVSVYHGLPTSIILTVQKDGEVLGTVTVIRDSKIGLPSGKILNLETIRKPGQQIAEISALAIKPEWRGRLFFPLIKYLYEACTQILRVDTMVVSVHSDWFLFYESLLFFKRIEDRTIDNYAFANFVPVVGEYLDLKNASYQYARHYAQRPLEKNLYHYFCVHKFKEFEWPKNTFHSIINPSMTPSTIDYFFQQKTDIFKSLSDNEYWVLHNIYRNTGIDKILPKPESLANVEALHPRKKLRIPSCLNGIAFDTQGNSCPMIISEVSQFGFRAHLANPNFAPSTATSAKVQVGDFDVAELQITACWQTHEATGYQISGSCKVWNAYIGFSENKIAEPNLKAA